MIIDLNTHMSYSAFMDEISEDEIYDKLIEYGLFSEKLPPIFDCHSFLEYCRKPSRPPFMHNRGNGYITYDSIRNINIPRMIGIPTPMMHEGLCKCLADNWSTLQQYFKDTTHLQKHCVSRIHIRKQKKTPAIFQMNYKNWRIDGTPEPDILLGKKYMVEADISKCFPSIYTHAIAWALVGKETAKKTINDDKAWYNKIDKATRNTKNGETNGILIGPHTSNIVSEIILCKIDQYLSEKWDYVRYIDDYRCYVKNYDEAETFLRELETGLRAYGLTLNTKKTKIRKLPVGITEQWVRKINNYICRFEKEHDYIDYKEIVAFIEFCIELMDRNDDNAAILCYAMRTLKRNKLTYNAKNYYLKMSISFSLIYPYIVPLLDECVFQVCDVDKNRLTEYLNKIYNQYIISNYTEACSFALYYATKYGVKLEAFDVNKITEKADAILAVNALLYSRKNKEKEEDKKAEEDISLLKKYARKLKDGNEFDEFWVFIYESLPKEQLSDDWKKMKENGVSFLKSEKQL